MAKETQGQIDASANAKAASDAVKADRERVAGINTVLAGDVFADLRAKAIAEGTSVADAKAAAFEIGQKANAEKVKGLEAENATAQAKLDAIAKGGSDHVAAQTVDDEETTTKPKTAGDSDDSSVYEKCRDQLIDSGMSEGKAIVKAADKYPISHEAAVKEMPASTAK